MILKRLASICLIAMCLGAGRTPPRLVTLVPSLAEDAVAIGAAAQLVGVSRFSDYPALAKVPRVGDYQSVDTERIVVLHPDVVIATTAQARLIAPLRALGMRVVMVHNDSYDDIFEDLRTVGALSDRIVQAQRVEASLRAQVAAIVRSVPVGRARPSVFVALGVGPIWTAGRSSYIHTLIELAGGRNAGDSLATPWGEFSDEALLAAQPDVVLSGYDTRISTVASQEPWKSLRAVREGHVLVPPNERITDAIFRPGPHFIEGLRWLTERFSSLSIATNGNDH